MSLERYMKCGYGICGQCALDDLLVCRDGPVFSSEQLRKSKEFGKIARIRSGKEVTIKEYAAYKNE
jgi:dihydroorotate dehydrogenase electron transfer subunit